MKNISKVLILGFCAALLVGASVFGTMAYLTSTETVTNTFTVGKVKIKLDEARVKEDGTYFSDHDERVSETNAYHLLPGHTYYKDPTVTVLKKSEPAYIRMLVTINEKNDLDAIFGSTDSAGLVSIFGDISADWELYGTTEIDDTRTYEFRHNDIVDAKDADADVVLDDLFETIAIPAAITGDQLATIEGLEITVVANAIQSDGFDDADAAWAAFSGN